MIALVRQTIIWTVTALAGSILLGCTADGPVSEESSKAQPPTPAEESTNNQDPPDNEESDPAQNTPPGQGMSPPAPPRWVLRDKDGQVVHVDVDALAYPQRRPTDLGACDAWEPTCFSVQSTPEAPLPMRLRYELATGSMTPCYQEYDETGLPRYYSSSDCTGNMYVRGFGGVPLVYKQGGGMVGASGQADLVEPDWMYRSFDGSCAETPVQGYSFWTLKPLPQDLTNLFPDAPYTLTWE